MTRDERTEMFTNWLMQNGIYSTFLCNCRDHPRSAYPNNLDALMDVGRPKEVIIRAFTWACTDEGYDYWDDLTDMWGDLFN